MIKNQEYHQLLQVYKASAGSGKTYQLAYNYIKYLFLAQEAYIMDDDSSKWYPNAHRTILAVTFTNKSTDEMKTRILDRLFQLSKNNFSSDIADYVEKLKHDCNFLADKDDSVFSSVAGKLLSDLLQDFPSFRVSTIDSFFQSIVRSFAQELNIDMNYRVELDTDVIIEEATDNMLNEKVNSQEFINWMLTFSQDNISEGKSWNIRKDIIALKDIINQESFRMETQHSESFNINSLAELKKFISIGKTQYLTLLSNACDEIKKYEKEIENSNIKSTLKTQILKLSSVVDNPDSFEIKKTIQDALDNDNDWWYTKANQKYLDNVFIDKLKVDINNVLNLIKEDSEQKKIYNTLKEINKNIYILGITQTLQENINQVCLDNDCVILSSTNEFIQKIIDNSDVPFIYEKTGSSIRHYMIDEFQDTSQLQWKNFIPLLKESFSQDYESLIVGDVKQSIYRWRNGDWNILNNIGKGKDFKDENKLVNIQSLDNNFRSAKNIVNFNNLIFTKLPKIIDPELCNLYNVDETKQHARSSNDGFVSCSFITPDKNDKFVDIALDKLIENIRALREINVPFSKMAIIVRRNNEGSVVANRLLLEKIPFYSADALKTSDNNAVKFILSLVEFCTDMKNLLFRANLLVDTYYLLGKNISEIDWMCVDTNSIDEWLSFWLRIWFENNNTNAITNKVNEIKKISKMSLLPMVQNIDKFFGLSNLNGSKQHYLFIQSLMDNINAFSEKFKYQNITNFLKYWSEKSNNISITMPNANNAIQIITIHKSKGLEFDAVFLPFINFKASKDGIVDSFHKEFLFTHFKQNKVILNINNKKLKNSAFNSLYDSNLIDKLSDMLNIFYVAVTRPTKYLFINFEMKKDSLGEKVKSILDEDEGKEIMNINLDTYTCGELVEIKDDNKNNNKESEVFNYIDINYKNNIDNNLFVKKGQSTLTEEERLKIKHGIIMHKIFENIKYFSDIDRVVNQFCSDGIIEDKNLIYEYIDEIRNSDVSTFFDDDNGFKVYNEIEIFNSIDDCINRCDRLMIKDNHAIIIDYKFGKINKIYENQIRNYISVVKNMGYENVDGYLLYFPDCNCIKVNENEI